MRFAGDPVNRTASVGANGRAWVVRSALRVVSECLWRAQPSCEKTGSDIVMEVLKLDTGPATSHFRSTIELEIEIVIENYIAMRPRYLSSRKGNCRGV